MSHAHDKLRAERHEETRYEEKARLCRDEVALTAVAMMFQLRYLGKVLGFSENALIALTASLEERHCIRAADMLSDAFNQDAIHSLMRDCTTWGQSVRADHDFQAIYDQLKGIGAVKK